MRLRDGAELIAAADVVQPVLENTGRAFVDLRYLRCRCRYLLDGRDEPLRRVIEQTAYRQLAQQVSEYATPNVREAFAELFTVRRLDEQTPQPIVRLFGDLVNQHIRKLIRTAQLRRPDRQVVGAVLPTLRCSANNVRVAQSADGNAIR